MKAILFKEFRSFFGSPIGYLVIAIFLLLTGLFLWVFEGDYNILNSGFADMTPFFTIAPWILLFLIPAVTMRSFSDEKKQGTMELLLTKSLSLWEIVNGKFLGAFLLLIIAIIPTLVYVKVIYDLGLPEGNIDFGSTLGSYFGLLFLMATYTSIGIYTSTLSDNQIVAFIVSVFLCFVIYFGFQGIANYKIFGDFGDTISSFGMDYHYKSMSRGVIDTRDILYFLGVIILFLSLTVYRIKPYKIKKEYITNFDLKTILISSLSVVIANIVGNFVYQRFDLTHDKRYTLSETSLNIIKNAKEPLYIDVFLEGNFPPEFKRLQNETKQILDEFKAYNPNIIYQFVNPLENPEETDAIIESFVQRGLTPINITVDDKGKQSKEMVFPWAIATYKDKSTKISLLKNKLGATTEQKVVSSVQHLEYAFADGFHKITTKKQKKIAVIKGKNELPDIFKADFLQSVRENYFIAPFPLDSVSKNPVLFAKALKTFDLAIIAKPKAAFSDKEKQVLDQFIINGGKTLWLVETVNIDMESLNKTGSSFAFPFDLGLNDMFFKYGFRINPMLVKDIQCAPISLASGNKGNQTQYEQYPWYFAPYIFPESKHPIVNNIDGVKLDFANEIDTLKNGIKKTVLLQSSIYSKKVGTPVEIDLKMVNEEPKKEDYQTANIPVSILLEGNFSSVFENRVLAFDDASFKAKGKPSKMIVVSDGDIIKNQLDEKGQPLELGFDKWTNKMYANKEFLMNCVNYLLDDNGLINIRSKEVDLPLLDKEKVAENYTYTQLLTVGLPLVLLLFFGIVITYLRKRQFGR